VAIKRGEIYFVNNSPLVVTVVIGTKGENITKDYPTNVRIPASASGLSKETVFLCFQIRSLDHSRFPTKPAGRLSEKLLEKVENKVRYCLGL